MPKTDFTQRAESTKKEPELLKLWENTYNERNSLNTGELFTLHDGPPYANGDVHVGHLLNKLLKDMSVKYHLMSGNKVDFRPGSDCHGLPTELAVQKKYGRLETTELRSKCADWANEFSNKQNETFKSDAPIICNSDDSDVKIEDYEKEDYKKESEIITGS